jgi:hypothetical protein
MKMETGELVKKSVEELVEMFADQLPIPSLQQGLVW